MATDFGPVPASQVKKMSTQVFDALEQGRRVLISKYGKVVAAIDPSSCSRYERLLAAYAVPGFDQVRELTAAEINQEGPAERIRAAENGATTLVTKNQKVYGVLRQFRPEPETATPSSDPDGREELLARFELDHPGAGAADFAAEVERVSSLPVAAPRESERPFSVLISPLSSSDEDSAESDFRTWVDAMMIKGFVYEQAGQVGAARDVMGTVLDRMGGSTDERFRRALRTVMLKAATLDIEAGRTSEAWTLAEQLVDELDGVPPLTFVAASRTATEV